MATTKRRYRRGRAAPTPEGRDKLVFKRLPSRRTNRPVHYRQMALFKATARIPFASSAKHTSQTRSFAILLCFCQNYLHYIIKALKFRSEMYSNFTSEVYKVHEIDKLY